MPIAQERLRKWAHLWPLGLASVEMEDLYDECRRCGRMSMTDDALGRTEQRPHRRCPDLKDDPRFCSYDDMERAHEEELARLFRTTGLSAGPNIVGDDSDDDDEEESEGEEEGF